MGRYVMAFAFLVIVPAAVQAQGHCCCKGQGGGQSRPAFSQSQLWASQQMALQAQQYQLGVALQQANRADEEMLRRLLASPQPLYRFAAAYVVGPRGLPFSSELRNLLRDRSPLVRQAAQRSLLLLKQQQQPASVSIPRGGK